MKNDFTAIFFHFGISLLIWLTLIHLGQSFLHSERVSELRFCSDFGFKPENGGRPDAAKVMVVVTDGESHDVAFAERVLFGSGVD